MSNEAEIYQIKVTLLGSRPPIWRRIQVPGNINLGKLHRILQETMGWTNSHLHQFVIGDTYYGEPHPDYGLEMHDERAVKLNEVAPKEKSRFIYEYDFGDSWEHELRVEKILPPEDRVRYPRCLDGARACPPEDCGGVYGYAELLAALQDPDHPEYEIWVDWVGEDFDPEAFDPAEINAGLRRIR